MRIKHMCVSMLLYEYICMYVYYRNNIHIYIHAYIYHKHMYISYIYMPLGSTTVDGYQKTEANVGFQKKSGEWSLFPPYKHTDNGIYI